MSKPRVLVVFYSRTGNTKRVAQEIAEALEADMEEIVDLEDRSGLVGYLGSLLDGFFQRAGKIRTPEKDALSYDLVILGSPVWTASVAAPMRAYLARCHCRFVHNLAFFLTHGGSGAHRMFLQMEDLCGKAPLSVVAVSEEDLATTGYRDKVRTFAAGISDRLAARHAAA